MLDPYYRTFSGFEKLVRLCVCVCVFVCVVFLI
jgi:hypothetical protein